MTRADRWLESFTMGVDEALLWMLDDASGDTEMQAAIAETGRYLREEGDWRGRLKLTKGWIGKLNVWESLRAEIAKRDDGKPWWKILDYADSFEVSEAVQTFFKPVNS